MIKKIYLILFLCALFTSCGKKGDPIYKEEKLKTEILSTKLIKIS